MSRLKDRLLNLRRQAGTPSASPLLDARTLAERIRRGRVQAEAKDRPARIADADVAALLHGQVVAPGLIVVDNFIPMSDAHGRQVLSELLSQPNGGLSEIGHVPAESMVFMDTETTGLSGGTGTLVFLLGMGRVSSQALQVRQYFLTGFGGEKALLGHATEWLGDAETLVTYNGKTFDAPLLATRYRLAGLHDPFAQRRHLDLLYPTRRAFAKHWPDCGLKTGERALLAFQRVDDLPGHEAPQAWFDFLRRGDSHRLPALLQHNYWDIVSLAALVPALAKVHQQPDVHSADILAIARHRFRQGDEHGAYRLLQEQRPYLQRDALLELARLHRRRAEWTHAVDIWSELAAHGCVESMERLAKFYEHVERDFTKALWFAERLLSGADSALHHRRCQRLRAKIAPTTANTSLGTDCS